MEAAASAQSITSDWQLITWACCSESSFDLSSTESAALLFKIHLSLCNLQKATHMYRFTANDSTSASEMDGKAQQY